MNTEIVWLLPDKSFVLDDNVQRIPMVFRWEVYHQEGRLALAKIVVPKETKIPDQPWVAIAVNQQEQFDIVFRGRLMGVPQLLDDYLWELHFLADHPQQKKQIDALVESLKVAPYWDPLFVSVEKLSAPEEVLEARSQTFYWDRVTGKVQTSDFLVGRQQTTLRDCFLKGSLKTRIHKPPLDAVQVRLKAEWLQTMDGEMDVGPYLAQKFSSKMINTLTPEAFEKHWPKPYTRLGRSGYWVYESQLKRISPPSTAQLNLYPQASAPFAVRQQGHHEVIWRRLKRIWFKAKLVIGWQYHQKRCETVSMTLKHQWGRVPSGRTKTLVLNLQDVGSRSGASFFQTDRGRQAIVHAIERAKCSLAASSRCMEIEAHLPLKEALSLTLDHSITLADESLPQGSVTGKLVAYRFVVTPEEAVAHIQIASSLGLKVTAVERPSAPSYVDERYGISVVATFYQTPSGIVFDDFHAQVPKEGVVGDLGREVLESISVQFDGLAQSQWLQLNQYPLRDHPMTSLPGTAFQMNFQDIQTQPVLMHHISVNIRQPWSSLGSQ